MTLPRAWYTAGTSSLWDTRGSYSRIEWERLPPIDRTRHDGTFAWLDDEPERYGLQFGLDDDDIDDDEIATRLDHIVRVARKAGLAPPPAFGALFANRERYGRIPSCTACYVDLPRVLAPIPGEPGAMLRFLNDQQCCLVWGLHLLPSGAHQIVVARPELHDPAEGETLEEVADLVEHEIVADDLEEFIHRFCLENALYAAAGRPATMTPEQAAYLEAARSARALH